MRLCKWNEKSNYSRFCSEDEIDYETTDKGQTEKGSVISQKSVAAFITEVIDSPEKYVRKNLGINKPDSWWQQRKTEILNLV